MRPQATRVALVVSAAALLMAGVGVALTGGVGVSGDVTINDPGGPTVTVYTGGGELKLDGPSGDGQVTVEHDDGQVTFSSDSETTAAVGSADLEGETTRIVTIDDDPALTINPGDKEAVTVNPNGADGTTQIEFKQTEVDDGEFDIEMPSTTGAAVTIKPLDNGGSIFDETIYAVKSDVAESNAGDVVASDYVNGDKITLDLPAETSNSQATYDLVTAETPVVDDASALPSGGESVNTAPVELSINVSDPDFTDDTGDRVNVTFYDASDDSKLGTDTLTADGTATATFDNPVGGSNEWYAVATDKYGNSHTSSTFTFEAPDQLEIRDVVTKELVTENATGDPINVSVEFYGDESTVERRLTDSGTVSLAGLPAGQRFSISVDAGDDYVKRQAIVPSVLEQQTAYLLPDNNEIETVSPRFVIEDPSNRFDSKNTEISLQRPIEIDGNTSFVAVAGDRVGINGFDPVLEKDQRYRIVVTNPDTGAQRELGQFTPTATEQVTLQIEDVEFDSVSNVEGLEWGASYLQNEDAADEIQFVFRDQFATDSLEYRIYERGDESNTLVNATAAGNATVTETVPSGQENVVWVVEWTTERENGDTLSASRPVSTSRLPIGPNLDGKWQTVFSMIGLFAVAGLFGAVNPGVGGIAVAATGGMFFLVGWLPDSTGGLMVVLALFVAVLSYVGRKARGATA